ncbi:MAG: hypothetical protein P9L99_02515 [Candidatus Lernaella stagnicola]|nr:hypothetical protein [Candidatus Lernaella stagnicola]
MSNTTFTFHCAPEDESARRELQAQLADLLPDWPLRESRAVDTHTGQKFDSLEYITVVILGLPSAVYTTWQLAEKAKLKEKLDRLIAWAQERRATHPEQQIEIELPGGEAMPLHQAKAEDMLAAIERHVGPRSE